MPFAAQRIHHTAKRRGIVLVIVLALLTLLWILIIAYLIVARQSKRGARYAASVEQSGTSPKDLLDMAFAQVARGTDNRQSVLGPHSLLEDLYGNDQQRGAISEYGAHDPLFNPAKGALIYFRVWKDGVDNKANTPDDYYGYYNGRVITMLTGSCAGQSSRITNYDVDKNDHSFMRLQMLPFRGMRSNGTGTWDPATAPRKGDEFLINGRPFNGTGFGLDTANGKIGTLDWKSSNNYLLGATYQASVGELRDRLLEYALLPNPARIDLSSTYQDLAGPGGADEEYDAADFQNMLLAARIGGNDSDPRNMPEPMQDRAKYRWFASDSHNDNSAPDTILPSLHRPDLINYWAKRWPATTVNELPRVLIGKIMLRPNEKDHPNFYDGAGSFNALDGPWDVDNDSDGKPDSVWVDLGMPIETRSDGRRFKPMFAIMCVDLDGKLNLNAHGGLNLIDGTGAKRRENRTALFARDTKEERTVSCTAGSGPAIGPAGVNLAWLFDPANSRECRDLMRGKSVGGRMIEGRYGEGGRRDVPSAEPGRTLAADATQLTAWSEEPLWSQLKWFDLPFDYVNDPRGYGLPWDLDGDRHIALDIGGQPLFFGSASTANRTMDELLRARFNHPYALRLNRRGSESINADGGVVSRDRPFSPAEMDRLLRPNDIDVSTTEPRLADLIPSIVRSARRRNLVTTESWDLPVPGMIPSLDMLNLGFWAAPTTGLTPGQTWPGHTHIVDMLRLRLKQNEITNPDPVNAAIKDLLAPELIAGLRLNINRILGNGIDDNPNPDHPNLVDEPAEAESETIWSRSESGYFDSVSLDHNNDGIKDQEDQYARQLLAKHIYVLLMLLADSNFKVNVVKNPPDPAMWKDRQETARYLAQWAVNLVDFRDADSIMTPFEYDLNPFADDDGNGHPWDVDGRIGQGSTDDENNNYRGRVWGTERPELLITETLALHDRRMEDTKKDDDGPKLTTIPDSNGNKDDDYDQYLRPAGHLFIELYNPNSQATPHRGAVRPRSPSELYTAGKLDLSKRAPKRPGVIGGFSDGDNDVGSPVWRISVIRDAETKRVSSQTPVIPVQSHLRNGFFVRPPGIITEDIGQFAEGSRQEAERFWANQPTSDLLVPPKGYAVIGPGKDRYFNQIPIGVIQQTYDTDQAPPKDARFSFRLLMDTATKELRITNSSGDSVDSRWDVKFGSTGNLNMPTLIDFDQTEGDDKNVRFSISEPKEGYLNESPTQLGVMNQFYDGSGDAGNHYLRGPAESSLRNRTVFDKTAVVLERLADPTKPWNPEAPNRNLSKDPYDPSLPPNPYVWVDWLDTTLTVFNSLDQGFQGPTQSPAEPKARLDADTANDPSDKVMMSKLMCFDSVTRIDGDVLDRNIWTGTWGYPSIDSQLGPKSMARTTLGYLNHAFHKEINDELPHFWRRDEVPDEFVGDPRPCINSEAVPTVDTLSAFPWFTWNNRPFDSLHELMLTSGDNPSDMLLFHSVGYRAVDPQMQVTQPGVWDSYEPGLLAVGHNVRQYFPAREYPFSHLQNFFLSTGETLGTTTVPPDLANPWGTAAIGTLDRDPDAGKMPPPPFSRALEYMRVASPFADCETMLDPRMFQAGRGEDLYPFYAPFNFISGFREPGRVNLNTVFDSIIWDAIVNDCAGTQFNTANQFWSRLWQARRGYGAPAIGTQLNEELSADSPTPTIFAAPFRSDLGSYLVPTQQLRAHGTTGSGRRYEVDAGLLRQTQVDPIHPDHRPLFRALRLPPIGDIPAGPPYRDAARSPYFAYEGIQRLSNLTTTRSNVYAVWITVGYFEVEDAPRGSYTDAEYSQAFPDGVRLGRELGADTGEINRHRAFYLIDRTIPVGFERGQDHNFQEAVLISRFIE